MGKNWLANIIMSLFGGQGAIANISSIVIKLISAMVAITPDHVNNFLFVGFAQRMILVFFAIGTGTLIIQGLGYTIKYTSSIIGGFAQHSPLTILYQMVKTIFLSLFYPFVVVWIMERMAQFMISSLAANVVGGGNAVTVAGIAKDGTVAIAGVALTALFNIPFVLPALLILGIVVFIIFLWDAFMDLVKFSMLTVMSPLLISLDFSGLGTFQMVFTKQLGIALTQSIRIWLFGLAIGPAFTSSDGVLASLGLMILAIQINKLIDIGAGGSSGLSFSSVAALAASPMTGGAASAVAKVGSNVMGKIGGMTGIGALK